MAQAAGNAIAIPRWNPEQTAQAISINQAAADLNDTGPTASNVQWEVRYVKGTRRADLVLFPSGGAPPQVYEVKQYTGPASKDLADEQESEETNSLNESNNKTFTQGAPIPGLTGTIFYGQGAHADTPYYMWQDHGVIFFADAYHPPEGAPQPPPVAAPGCGKPNEVPYDSQGNIEPGTVYNNNSGQITPNGNEPPGPAFTPAYEPSNPVTAGEPPP